MSARIVVVGGGLAGLRAAEHLVSLGWRDEILVLGAEVHPPYQRPPLSKALLTNPELRRLEPTELLARRDVALRQRHGSDQVSWRHGTVVTRADLHGRTIDLYLGETIEYDGLVVASGLRPRLLPLEGFEADRHALRSLEDAIALRERLRPGARICIVGGGFIGCEIAASAVQLGCQVDVVEPLEAPMLRALGQALATAVQQHHEDQGVRFHLGRSVDAFAARSASDPRLGAVVLDDGTEIVADLLVEAVGSEPNTEWLEGNRLDLSDGVLCDNELRVQGWPGAVAVGDIARFPNPRFDIMPRRVEHWSMASDTAARAAATLLADLRGGRPAATEPFAPVPSFWSDQFGLRLQGFGSSATATDTALVEGELRPGWEERGVTVVHLHAGQVVGVVTAGGTPAQRLQAKQLLADPASADVVRQIA